MLEQWYAEQNVGRYFLNKGLLSIEQICLILENSANARVKLETLAVAFGFMTAQEALRVLSLQGMLDRRFSAVAVEAGYLTQEQAALLLEWPENANLNFCQAVLDYGYMTLRELDAALTELRARQRAEEPTLPVSFDAGMEEGAFFEIYMKYARFFLRRIAEQLGVKNVKVCRAAAFSAARPRVFLQKFRGYTRFDAGIAADEATFLALASRFSTETIEAFGELAVDSVKEFLNLHNGLFAVHLSNEGLEVDLEPVELMEAARLPAAPVVVRSELGDIALVLQGETLRKKDGGKD